MACTICTQSLELGLEQVPHHECTWLSLAHRNDIDGCKQGFTGGNTQTTGGLTGNQGGAGGFGGTGGTGIGALAGCGASMCEIGNDDVWSFPTEPFNCDTGQPQERHEKHSHSTSDHNESETHETTTR